MHKTIDPSIEYAALAEFDSVKFKCGERGEGYKCSCKILNERVKRLQGTAACENSNPDAFDCCAHINTDKNGVLQTSCVLVFIIILQLSNQTNLQS
jgi:hypothetical protein